MSFEPKRNLKEFLKPGVRVIVDTTAGLRVSGTVTYFDGRWIAVKPDGELAHLSVLLLNLTRVRFIGLPRD